MWQNFKACEGCRLLPTEQKNQSKGWLTFRRIRFLCVPILSCKWLKLLITGHAGKKDLQKDAILSAIQKPCAYLATDVCTVESLPFLIVYEPQAKEEASESMTKLEETERHNTIFTCNYKVIYCAWCLFLYICHRIKCV